MVHAISSSARPAHARPPLDATRIVAVVGAIAFNAVLLMLLLVPMTSSQLLPRIIDTPDLQWIKVRQLNPVEPPPAEPVEVEKSQPEPVATVTRTPVAPEPVETLPPIQTMEPMVIELALPADPPVAAASDSVAQGRSDQPPGGVRLRYAQAPPPAYPPDALRRGLTGTVVLEVLVGIDGHPLEVRIVDSSGHRRLDAAARRQVLRHWTFEPALDNGRAVQALGLVPIEFSLD